MAPSETGGDPSPDSDAYGRAALLLVESLIHGLVARSVLSVPEAVEIMEVALETQEAIAQDAAHPTPSMHKATALLSSLVHSLRMDLPQETSASPEPGAG